MKVMVMKVIMMVMMEVMAMMVVKKMKVTINTDVILAMCQTKSKDFVEFFHLICTSVP